jgi:hypothetical protein
MLGQKILIIRVDGGSHAQFMMDCLSEAGYETWLADQGEKATGGTEYRDGTLYRTMIRKVIPNLVILDWGLQNSTGLALSTTKIIRTIREDDRHGDARGGSPGFFGSRSGYLPDGKSAPEGPRCASPCAVTTIHSLISLKILYRCGSRPDSLLANRKTNCENGLFAGDAGGGEGALVRFNQGFRDRQAQP